MKRAQDNRMKQARDTGKSKLKISEKPGYQDEVGWGIRVEEPRTSE